MQRIRLLIYQSAIKALSKRYQSKSVAESLRGGKCLLSY